MGSSIALVRTLNERGKLLYFNDFLALPFGFGFDWDERSNQAEGVVAYVNDQGDHQEFYSIGLSAIQLSYLSLTGSSSSDQKSGSGGILNMLRRQRYNRIDPERYGRVRVSNGSKVIEAVVYNAFGVQSAPGDCVTISKMLSDDLGLGFGDKLQIERIGTVRV